MRYFIILFFIFLTPFSHALEKNLVKATLLAQSASPVVQGKQDLIVGINLKITEGWHIYWQNSGEAGAPTKVVWDLPLGSSIGSIRWPAPERFLERGNIVTFGYQNEVTLLADISVPENSSIKAEARWLVCKDICIPGSALLELDKISLNDDKINSSQNLTPKINSSLIEEINSYGEQNKKYILIKLDLKKLNTKFELEKNIQVFTDVNIPVSKAEINSQGWIRLESVGNIKPSGIIVLSKELLDKAHDSAISWQFNDFPKFDASKKLEAFKELSFRSHGKKLVNLSQAEQNNLPFYIILIYAIFGGLILNFMPCVLPVVSIKALSFIENSEKTQNEAKKSVLGFSAGIISCFILLASIVSILRNAGISVGWGFQFQHPEFVFSMILIIFILALGFFDIYTIGVSSLCKTGSKIDKLQNSFFKDFLDGALATALSTPCSAPLLGVSLLVAFSQSTVKTFIIFIFIGIGLALPYAVFSLSPKLIALLPKPGCWMYRIKHFMGFCLLATCIWLLFVLENLQAHSAFWTLAIMLCIYLIFWFNSWKKESTYKKPFYLAYLATSISIITLIPNVLTSFDNREKIIWKPYSNQLINELTKEGKTVFIDFTADWCVTCKANEIYTISSSAVKKSIKDNQIETIKADWTKGDQEITDALNNFGAQGVPLYVVISPLEPDKPKVLPTIITPSILIEAFESASIK